MRPELLSPAGSVEALHAAVQNGADAVYLGWGDFNARRNAKNFTDEEFSDALRYCHERGVRVFLTLNTLLRDRELPQAVEVARRACEMGVDAVLVQDWGLFTLLRQCLPELPLHASTQMSLFTSGGAETAAALGCERVVIARECSREDTREICRRCPVEVEVFVHGALCMCYSGQCAMSALIGGRSGNRGQCAQPCRLPYALNAPAGNRHALSLKDSCLAGELREMEQMGVACLKLEGRMKRPEYVATVTGIYARLLEEGRKPTRQELHDLEPAFSREGFTDWYWQGRRGSGMFGSRPENAADPKELFAAAKVAYEKENLRTVPVYFHAEVTANRPAVLTAWDDDGHSVTVSGAVPEAARNRAVTEEEICVRLQKTGGTAYRCAECSAQVEEGLSLPASAVNALRRDALAALSDARTAVSQRRQLPLPQLKPAAAVPAEPELTVSLSRWEQLTPELLTQSPARIALPLELFSIARTLPEAAAEWCAILPRVWRDRDEPELKRLLSAAQSAGVTGVLLGNLGHLPLVEGMDLHRYGDYGLNVFNSWSLEFLRQMGLDSATVSFELRGAQIRDLNKVLPTEAIVYGRLPLMLTENCLVQNDCGCKLDRNGTLVPENGPCRQTNVLNDRTGAAFPLLPAYGHRTEVQNCKPLYLGDRSDWKQLGLRYARLRFTTETPEACVQVLRAYREGSAAPAEFTRGLFDRGVE